MLWAMQSCADIVESGICQVKGTVDSYNTRIFCASNRLPLLSGIENWAGESGEIEAINCECQGTEQQYGFERDRSASAHHLRDDQQRWYLFHLPYVIDLKPRICCKEYRACHMPRYPAFDEAQCLGVEGVHLADSEVRDFEL